MVEAQSPTMTDTDEEKTSFSSSDQASGVEPSSEAGTSPLLFRYADKELEETAFADQNYEDSVSLDFDPSQLVRDINIDIKQPSEYFVALQKWEGYVTEVFEETFRAQLTPIKGQGGGQETEILLQEIDEKDRQLVEPGAVFYWSIGYDDRPSGRQRASRIRFRRLPAWSAREIEHANQDATRIKSLLFDGE